MWNIKLKPEHTPLEKIGKSLDAISNMRIYTNPRDAKRVQHHLKIIAENAMKINEEKVSNYDTR